MTLKARLSWLYEGVNEGVKFTWNSTLALMSDPSQTPRDEVLKAYAKLGFGPRPPQTRHIDGQIHPASEALGQHPALQIQGGGQLEDQLVLRLQHLPLDLEELPIGAGSIAAA